MNDLRHKRKDGVPPSPPRRWPTTAKALDDDERSDGPSPNGRALRLKPGIRQAWITPYCHAGLLSLFVLCLIRVPAHGARPASRATATQSTGASSRSVFDVATEVVKVVGQSDAQTRRDAAIEILRHGGPEGIKALVSLFATENNEDAKLALCEAIAEVRPQSPDFIPALQQLLEHDDATLRKAASGALAGYNDPQVAARLEGYRQEQERRIMIESLRRLMETLYQSTTAEAKRTQLLEEWLKADLPVIRIKALDLIHEALRREGTKPSSNVLDLIRGSLNDPNESARQRFIVVLRDLGLLEDAPRIRELLKQEKSAIVREEIYKSLGKLADVSSIPACVAGLGDPSEDVVAAAADALGRLCEKGTGKSSENTAEVGAALIQRLAQPTVGSRLRAEIIEAMSDIADPRCIGILVKHASEAEPEAAIRQAALRGLGRIGKTDYLPVCVERLTSDTNAGVREVAAEAIGLLGNQPGHLQVLRDRLDAKLEPAPAVQNQAWKAYQLIFQRLAAPDQASALASWSEADPKNLARRIELLANLETQMSTRNPDPRALMGIRERLGDTYLAAGQIDDAIAAWGRASTAIPADQPEALGRLLTKMIDAQLKSDAPDKAIALAAKVKVTEIRNGIAARLLQYLQDLKASDPKATIALLGSLMETIPDRFGIEWSAKFDSVLRAAQASLPVASGPAASRPAR